MKILLMYKNRIVANHCCELQVIHWGMNGEYFVLYLNKNVIRKMYFQLNLLLLYKYRQD